MRCEVHIQNIYVASTVIFRLAKVWRIKLDFRLRPHVEVADGAERGRLTKLIKADITSVLTAHHVEHALNVQVTTKVVNEITLCDIPIPIGVQLVERNPQLFLPQIGLHVFQAFVYHKNRQRLFLEPELCNWFNFSPLHAFTA